MPLVSLGSLSGHSGETAVVGTEDASNQAHRASRPMQSRQPVHPPFSRDQEKLILRNNAISHLRESAYCTYILKEDPMFWTCPSLELGRSAPVAARHRAEDAHPTAPFDLAAAHKVGFSMSTNGNWWVLAHWGSEKYAL